MWTAPFWSACTAKGPLDLHSLGVPVVLAGRPFGNDDDLSYVDAGNIGGARMAVRYLLKHGRSTVATVAGPPDMSLAWTGCAATGGPWPRLG